MNSYVWYDQGLQRTNPVHVVEQVVLQLEREYIDNMPGTARSLGKYLSKLTAEGTYLPAFAVESLKRKGHLPDDLALPEPPRPGVLGLVVNPATDLGFVLSLRAEEREPSAEGWEIDPLLPFKEGAILDVLARLIESLDLPTAGLLPERLAFAFKNPLGHWTYGNSMTIAAALAVLDSLGGCREDLFRCACAVVEPAGDQLQPVKHISRKLEAVRREHGRGSLLIAHPDEPVSTDLRTHFEELWVVKDLAQLAHKLDEFKLLAPLQGKTPLRRVELQRVRNRLHWLVRTVHQYDKASKLGGRVEDCPTSEDVPLRLWDDIRGFVAEVARHQGRYVEAIERSRKIHADVLRRGRFTSYDEQADAAAEYAASLFDLHDFERIPELLEELARVAKEDEPRLRPQTRVKVLNTLARAMVVLRRDGWEKYFLHSRELLERIDPGDVPRTLSYHIHGLLRTDQLKEARELLDRLSLQSPWVCFLWAEWARRAGKEWQDPNMESARPGVSRPGHPYAFYCQAVARQEKCADAMELLGRGADFLRADAGGHPQNICSFFANCMDLLAAARADDQRAWAASALAVRGFLADPAAQPLQRHYQPALAVLDDTPALATVEGFLQLNPYL